MPGTAIGAWSHMRRFSPENGGSKLLNYSLLCAQVNSVSYPQLDEKWVLSVLSGASGSRTKRQVKKHHWMSCSLQTDELAAVQCTSYVLYPVYTTKLARREQDERTTSRPQITVRYSRM